MQASNRMRQQRITSGVLFCIWSPEETSIRAGAPVVTGNLQAAEMEKVHSRMELITLTQHLRQRSEHLAWPPAVLRSGQERFLLRLGTPIIQKVTQECLLTAFASDSAVFAELLCS